MAIRLKLTKKLKIIIIVVFVLILGGSGGYLLWRTNQTDTVAPIDSNAGTQGSGICYYCCEGSKPACTDSIRAPNSSNGGWQCDTAGNVYCAKSVSPYCKSSTSSVKCGDGASIPKPTDGIAFGYSDAKLCNSCNHAAPDDDGPVGGVECNVGSQCNKECIWPEVNYCKSDGTCTCKGGSNNGCTTTIPCEPVCPTGYEKCTNNCGTGTKTAECTDRCEGCNNKYINKITCKKKDSSNTCDSGEWLTKPTGSYKYCDPITYTAKAKDKDGIDKTSVVAKLNNASRTATVFTNETTTSLDFSEPLSITPNCLPAGAYTLDLKWKDKKGAESTNCTLTTTFSILAEEQSQDWKITKTGAEKCLESGDAQVIYTIKIKNIGTVAGSIDKIIDTLDSKVLASYITGTISSGGLFGSGSITWELEGADETFAADQEKSYTYTLVIPKTAFGTYTNTAAAYPTTGENFSDSTEVKVDCVQDIPQTGIFDSTVVKIATGIILLLLGFNLHRIDTSFRRVQNSLNKLSISIQDAQNERRKRNFEKKIVKK